MGQRRRWRAPGHPAEPGLGVPQAGCLPSVRRWRRCGSGITPWHCTLASVQPQYCTPALLWPWHCSGEALVLHPGTGAALALHPGIAPGHGCSCPAMCPCEPLPVAGSPRWQQSPAGAGRSAFSTWGWVAPLSARDGGDTACLGLWVTLCHFTRAASPRGSLGRGDSGVTCARWEENRASWGTGSVWGQQGHGVSQAPARVGWHRAGTGDDIPGGGTNTAPALARCPATEPPPQRPPSLCPPAGLLRFEVPSLHVPPDAALRRDLTEAPQRLLGPGPATRQEEEEESESTAL